MNNSIMMEMAIQHCETLLNDNFKFDSFSNYGNSTLLISFVGDTHNLFIVHFGFLTRHNMIRVLQEVPLRKSCLLVVVDKVDDSIIHGDNLILDIANCFEVKKLSLAFPSQPDFTSNVYLLTADGDEKAMLKLPCFQGGFRELPPQERNFLHSKATRWILKSLFKYKAFFYPVWRRIPFSIRTQIRLRLFRV